MHVFDPTAYGCPTARAKTNECSGVQQKSYESAWTVAPAHKAGSSSYESNEPGNVVEASLDKTMPGTSAHSQGSTSATTPPNSKFTGFNPYAYGHPGASRSSQEHTPVLHSKNLAGQSGSGGKPLDEQDTEQTAHIKKSSTSDRCPASGQIVKEGSVNDHSSPQRPIQTEPPVLSGLDAPSTSPTFLQKHVPEDKKEFESEVGPISHNHVPSGLPRGGAEKKREMSKGDKTKTPPATYETLKKDGETPQQVIARLQQAATREIGLRVRRQAKGDPGSAALTVLDFLREPVQSTEVGQWGSLPTELQAVPAQNQNANAHQPQHEGTSVGGAHHQGSEQDVSHNWHQPDRGGAVSSKSRKQYTAETAIPSKQDRYAWAAAEEMKAPSVKADSNAEGSEDLESDDGSLGPMGGAFGRLIRSREPAVEESSLCGWDGKMQPPPLEWEHRPRFNNNNPDFMNSFEAWLRETTMWTMQSVGAAMLASKGQDSADIGFGIFPPEVVCNLDNHADGIRFVPADIFIHPEDKELFPLRLPGEYMLLPVVPPDFEGQAKLDWRDKSNRTYKEETAQMFIDKRMLYVERNRKAPKTEQVSHQPPHEKVALAEPEPATPEPVMPEPTTAPVKSNIYLRPAVTSDFAGMTRILNWHISNGSRPGELQEIDEQDMAARHEACVSARLPVIVAVERNRRNAHRKPHRRRHNPNHPIQNFDPDYNAVVKGENVVGWASATDWSLTNYVEATTAEIEIYVAPEFRKQGVGRCLMDALLDATDRGYNRKGGYNFHVAPETQHLYTSGGGRDLHKIIFQVRSFNQPYTPAQVWRMNHAGRRIRDWNDDACSNHKESEPMTPKEKDYSKEAKLDNREDDYTVWMKEWLESFGFEEEAWLKKIGTKNKRFVDVRYLTRETRWQPTDGKLPDFSRGL